MYKKIKTQILKHKFRYIIVLAGLLWFWFSLPNPLFQVPYATVLTDKHDELLSARISRDGQWRFPPPDSVPYKFKQCIVQFEDAYFYRHPGVNPVSLLKAVYQDIKAGKIIRGGSTLTMQTIRLSRDNPPRNVYQKFIEIILALRLEISYSKDEILNMYASHAPFGGNVVGLEAASWRYYGRPAYKLSWGEAATLAVLPNAPALIYPGKNHEILSRKRNRLLDKLQKEGIIDATTCELAKAEPLPDKPKALPQLAPHLLTWAQNKTDGYIHSSLDKFLQKQVLDIAQRHHQYLSANKIYNMGVMVVSVPTGKVVAYVGNVKNRSKDKGDDVDVIRAPRSTGSLLKPFLYAWAMKDAVILPGTLLKDVPTQIAGYHPKNYNKTYDGMVPASQALARSLNVPAVRLLREYGLQKFRDNLQKLQLPTIDKPANYYGLTLILGGAEIRLWDAVKVYAGMGRSLYRYNQTGKYYNDNYSEPVFLRNQNLFQYSKVIDNPPFGADNIWLVFEALSAKDRPVEGDDWNIYRSARKIAWKTGTSFGHRDAWCVGVTPKYVVGVWVGNASGEGRPGLTGTQSATPVMFDVFEILSKRYDWFQKPFDALKQAEICSKSGYLASENCVEKIWTDIPFNGERTEVCPYHQIIHLDKTGRYQVNSTCYSVADMQSRSWFVLPPVPAWYYRKKHADYKPLPPWNEACQPPEEHNMDVIYPKNNTRIFLPKDFDNLQQKTVFKAVHRRKDAVIYWHINNKFIAQTNDKHQLEIYIPPGKHILTLVDDTGEMIMRKFEVVAR